MARYEVRFRKSAEKDLCRLDSAIQRRVLKAAEALADEPRPAGCKKLHGSEDAYRVRVGDYRIVYTLDDAVRIVAIERIRHRREVYR
jgi:mRNA interferase RelE/StbE